MRMSSTRNYALLTIRFLISYCCTIISLIFPEWIVAYNNLPFIIETHYGIFRKCGYFLGRCKDFPSQIDWDCSQDKFCQNWSLLKNSILFNIIFGAILLVVIIYLTFRSLIKQKKYLPVICLSILVQSVFQSIATWIVLFYYLKSPEPFMSGHTSEEVSLELGFCFFMNLFSLILNVINFFMLGVDYLTTPDYIPIN